MSEKFFGPLAPLEKLVSVVSDNQSLKIYDLVRSNKLEGVTREYANALRSYREWGMKVLSGDVPEEGIKEILAQLPVKTQMLGLLLATEQFTNDLIEKTLHSQIMKVNDPAGLEETLSNTELLDQHGLTDEYVKALAKREVSPDADVMDFILSHSKE